MNCPICNHKLYKKHEGFVCKNSKCKIGGFKLGVGWCFMQEKNNFIKYFLKYDFDLQDFENRKEMLILKSRKIYEKKCCEICKSNNQLHVHHILKRSIYPELTLDYDNLMVLCEVCHKKIHSDDKYFFGGRINESF